MSRKLSRAVRDTVAVKGPERKMAPLAGERDRLQALMRGEGNAAVQRLGPAPRSRIPETVRDWLYLQRTAGNEAVSSLLASASSALPLQRKPPAAPPKPAPKTEAQLEAGIEIALQERYRLLREATSHASVGFTADQGMSVAAAAGPPAAKHTVVGGARQVAAMWKGIESHIRKPAVRRPPLPALSELYSAEGVASLKALSNPDRERMVADVRSLLTTYATDDQMTGTGADVDTIVGEIVNSFWQSYQAAGGPAAGPEHIAVPDRDLPLYYVKSHWLEIEKQILNPKQRPGVKAADELMHVVYVGEVVDQLALLPPSERAAVKAAVFDLLTQVASDEAQNAKTVQQDYAQLTEPLHGAIEYKEAGLVYVRGPLLNTFKSFKAANAYYEALVDGQFAGATAHQVYSAMQQRLQKADTKLKELDPEGTLNGTLDLSGLSVRENRSQKSKLSNHSFGCAIDVNANQNPLVRRDIIQELSPVIEQITGVKLYEGSKGPLEKHQGKKEEKDKNFTWGLTAAEIIPEAERLRSASDKVQEQFKDEDSLKQEMLAFAQKYASDKKLALPGTAEADSLLDGAKLAALKPKTMNAFARSIYIEQGPLEAAATRATAKDGLYVAQMLTSMYRWFVEGQQMSGPEAIAPGPGDVVRFGFLNLDPRIIAALAGTDGGGLKWLGAQTGGNKDFMHFDLPKDSLPPEAAMNQ